MLSDHQETATRQALSPEDSPVAENLQLHFIHIVLLHLCRLSAMQV